MRPRRYSILKRVQVWASSSRRDLVWGGLMGAILVTCAVFIFGFGGWLSAWAGLINYSTTNPNLYLFQVFSAQNPDPSGDSAAVNSWVGVLALILAVTMNESAIDSMQTGINAIFAAHFFKDQHLIFSRLCVFLVNIPLIVVSLQNYQILALFLMTNMLTTCCCIPVAVGLVDILVPFISETCALFGCCVAILTLCAYGIGRNWEESGHSLQFGVWYAWYGNTDYWWDYFLVASGFSVVGMLIWALPAWALRQCGIHGPGISGVLRYIPGFDLMTGGGFGFDLLSPACMAPLARLLKHNPEPELPVVWEEKLANKEGRPEVVVINSEGDTPQHSTSEDEVVLVTSPVATATVVA